MIRLRTSALLAAATLAAACVSTSVKTFGSPDEATAYIVETAVAGDYDEAARVFETYASSSIQRDRVFVDLYDAAQTRYETSRAAEAANLMRFVTTQYPDAVAAREALVMSLFMERAERDGPTDAGTRELDEAIAAVRESSDSPSAWVDLAATQTAIDRGDLDDARREFRNFTSVWNGGPAQIVPYVEDIDRYLATH